MSEYGFGKKKEKEKNTKYKIKKIEKTEKEFENNFKPNEEEQGLDTDFVDNFEPKDELNSNKEHFEVDFTPRDEPQQKETKVKPQEDKRKDSKRIGNLSEMHIIKDLDDINIDKKENFEPTREIAKNKGLNYNLMIGNISEMNLIRDLERDGKKVSIPYGDYQRYDLLFEEKGKINRVQVKTARKRDNTFPICSRSSKGEFKNYNGEIEYFGVYHRSKNKSYLIPIVEINKLDKIYSVKLDKLLRYKSEIKNPDFNSINKGKISDSITNKSIRLISEGKIVLTQLGKRNENIIVYDDILKINEKAVKHNFYEIKLINKERFEKANIDVHTRIEIARANVAADLMSNGFIISTPIRNNSQYDFIIQQKYGEKHLSGDPDFYKVKIIERNLQSIKSDGINEIIDYIGIFDDRKNKSYLIPSQDFNIKLKNINSYEIKRSDNVLNNMTFGDRGDAIELRIGAELMKSGYEVYHPFVGKAPYDLVVKKNDKYYTIEVKTGRTHYEKDSTYIRFDIASRKPNLYPNNSRISYKGKVDFIASVNQDNFKSYIVPVNDLPNNDAKLKLDERKDMRRMHHGTIWAKNYELNKVDSIIQEYEATKRKKIKIDIINREIEEMSKEKRGKIEKQQVLDVLKGNLKVEDILSTNSTFANYSDKFKKSHPKSNLEYQGVLSVAFRDFLISQPDLKRQINNYLKKKGFYGRGEAKHQIFYEFIDTFYRDNRRGPNTLELYHNFLNFKSYELRGKINTIREKYPHYYTY